MARCDVGTVTTLVVFFLVGLFAGGRLRGSSLETFALTAVIPDAAIPDAAAAAGVAPAPPGSPGQELAGTSLSPDKSHAVAPAKKPAASAAGDDDSVPGGNRFAALAAHLPKLPLPRDVLPREREPPTTMAHVTANASSEPLLPEIFVPCCAKTGTTFLWGCASSAFRPSQVCGSNKASEWDKANCGSKRYVLPGFRITPGGCRAERKEYFFWGGGKGEDGTHYHNKGIRWLTGSPTPLYYWQRNARACHASKDLEKMCYEDLPSDIDFSLIKRAKNKIEQVPEDGRMHPACKKLKLPPRSMLVNGVKKLIGKERVTLEMECALPWLDKRKYPGAMNMDFTPNHMQDPKTPMRLWDNVPNPQRIKFVVTLRNPLKRAYSEWSMFVKWNWERVRNFGRKLDMEVDKLRSCNSTIFANTSLVLTLPHEEFSVYHSKCFTGQAMEYVRNSMYIIGFRNMMRVFSADQFLVIWSEDMQVVPAADLLRAFADFTGLTFDPASLEDRVTASRCRTGKGGSRPNHQSFDKGMTQREAALLREIFAPYEDMLEVWLKHYGVKVALKDHPNVIARRERLRLRS